MSIVTAEISSVWKRVWAGWTTGERLYWEGNNAFSYTWVQANNWPEPPPGVSKLESAGNGFVNELPETFGEFGLDSGSLDEVLSETRGGFGAQANLPPTQADLTKVIDKISQSTVDEFSSKSWDNYGITIAINSVERIAEVHRDEWYSYAGIYLLYTTMILPIIAVSNQEFRVVLRKKSCQDRDSLPENVAVLREDCGAPLPSFFEWAQIRARPKKRRPEMSGCCSCAAIADMNAQMLEQIKLMFDAQNNEIGSTLTDQTQFIQDQIVAAIPKGFDYQPIFNKIEDARNDIWNGLNK